MTERTWKIVEMERPQPPDIERARKAAFDAMLDGIHFHELVISDPFEAERQFQALANEVVKALGYPEGVNALVAVDA